MTPLVNLLVAALVIIGLPILFWLSWKAWSWVRATMAAIEADDEGWSA